MTVYKPKNNFIKQSLGERAFDAFNVLFMLLVIAVMLLPFLHVLNVSISSGSQSLTKGFFLLPRGQINFTGYVAVFKDPTLFRSFLNTITYCVGALFFTLFFTALTAYPLSVKDFILKRFVTLFLTITMFFSGGLIPTYLLIRKLHLMDKIWVMMIPFCVGAWNVILFRTFFSGIPSELREAAIMDGASEFYVLFRVYFPLSKAIFATIGLFTVVGTWNDWFTALLYLNNSKMYPIQMVLRKLIFNTNAITLDPWIMAELAKKSFTSQNIIMATIIVTILPILCVYPFLQKYFVKGVFIGSIKG
jgi:putative aldouronate transport system permease protein